MAKFVNLTRDLRFAVHGLRAPVSVQPGAVLEVPDDVADAYACQPEIWGPPKATKPTAASTAGTNTPSEG